MADWQTMRNAPRDGTPILGWCDHFAERDWSGAYMSHCELNEHARDGLNLLQWGGDCEEESLDPWWFVKDTAFQIPANPTHWMPVPDGPSDGTRIAASATPD